MPSDQSPGALVHQERAAIKAGKFKIKAVVVDGFPIRVCEFNFSKRRWVVAKDLINAVAPGEDTLSSWLWNVSPDNKIALRPGSISSKFSPGDTALLCMDKGFLSRLVFISEGGTSAILNRIMQDSTGNLDIKMVIVRALDAIEGRDAAIVDSINRQIDDLKDRLKFLEKDLETKQATIETLSGRVVSKSRELYERDSLIRKLQLDPAQVDQPKSDLSKCPVVDDTKLVLIGENALTRCRREQAQANPAITLPPGVQDALTTVPEYLKGKLGERVPYNLVMCMSRSAAHFYNSRYGRRADSVEEKANVDGRLRTRERKLYPTSMLDEIADTIVISEYEDNSPAWSAGSRYVFLPRVVYKELLANESPTNESPPSKGTPADLHAVS